MDTREVLQAHFKALQDEIAAIEKKSAPLRAARDKLVAEMQPLEDRARELANGIKAAEGPRLFDLKMELSAVAKAMGGKRMSVAE